MTHRPKGKESLSYDLLQVWENGAWKTILHADGKPLNFIGLQLYPRMHVASDGRVFMSGTIDRTLLVENLEAGPVAAGRFSRMGRATIARR